MRQRRLHRDQPVEQVLLVVLEADVEHVGLAARRDVAGHLEGHRGLAGALGAADQQQLAGAEARADRLVERREAERDRLVLADLAGRDLVVEVDEHVQRRARRHAAVVGLEAPVARRGQLSAAAVRFAVGAHAVRILPGGLPRGAHGPRYGWHREMALSPIRTRPVPHSAAVERARARPTPDDRPDAALVVASQPLVRGMGVSCGWVKPEQHDRQAEDRLEARRDRDRAALADVHAARGRTSPRARGRRPGSPGGRCGVRLGPTAAEVA